MTLSEYRETYGWQAAIELGPKLLNLAEELPTSEEMALSFQLRQLTVEVPAALAADLLKGDRPRLDGLLKLATVLELIDNVYPAIDVAEARRDTDALTERLAGDDYAERHTAAPAAAAAEESPEPAPADLDATPLTPAEETAPVSVAVTAEPQESDVQPDSGK